MARKIYGTNDDDVLEGGAGVDIVNAKAGDDDVSTGGSADKVFGKSGEDTIELGGGSDKAFAGPNDDYVDGDNGSDTIYGGSGDDLLYGGDVNPFDGSDNFGGGVDDRIWGGAGADEIHGQSGNDQLYGQSGDDVVSGQAGADQAFGGKGIDDISGGVGNDLLDGGADADLVYGDAGADTLKGAPGSDELWGGTGNDTIDGGSDDDAAYGEEGNDILVGAGGKDLLKGGQGNDQLYGGDKNDALNGGAGTDQLFGGSGADVMYGGTGKDLLQGDNGNDVLRGEEGDDVINAGAGHDIAYGGGADDTINLYDGNDRAIGGAGEDTIDGGNGNDVIYGDKLPENLLAGDSSEVGQSIAQFEDSDWVVTNDPNTGQTEMSQSVDTDAKATYTISIDVAANFSGGFTSGAVEVLWNGEVIDKIEVDSGVFETLSYDVQGIGQGTGLAIRTAEPDNPSPSIYDTSGPILTYEKTIDLGDGPITVDAFAPGQAKLFQVIDGQLQVFDTTSQTYVGAGVETGVKVNAIGLNIQDDLIYGYAKASGFDALGKAVIAESLVMMDATGKIYKLGDGDHADFVGDFDGNGNLWTFHTSLDHVTRIDVDNLDAAGNPLVETFDLPPELSRDNVYDVAYNPRDGLFYGVVAPGSVGGQGKILMIDLEGVESGGTPTIAEIPITRSLIDGTLKEGMAKGAYGAVFMDGLGNLYAGLNNGDHDLSPETANSGGIYRIVFDENGQYATAELMSSAQTTGNNDGAMDTRGNDPFADIDATANVLVKNITVVEAAGEGWDDDVFGGEGNDTIYGGGRNDKINGGLGDDVLYGEAGLDTIFGLEGDDFLFGGIGNDALHGGDGNDEVAGGLGNDSVSGGAANDTLSGGLGNDTLNGNEGDDRLHGGGGNDQMFGNAGEDHLLGGAGNDSLNGGEDTDVLSGGAGNDSLAGGLGGDSLNGDSGNDTLFGNAGDDHLDGGSGNDGLHGGSGADHLFGQSGNDTIFGGSDGDTLHGNDGNDLLTGEAGADVIYGGAGSDTIFGGAGNDTIEAGKGKNILSGGDGADTFIFLSDNGVHHDQITDFQVYGQNADTLDLTAFAFLDSFESAEAWRSENVSLTDGNAVKVKLGYGQSVTLVAETDFTSGDLVALYDTFLL